MKVSILGIGTELTDGQIINKNAAWISAQLKKLGLSTKLHLVVPDERSLIRESLDFCAEKSDLIFVTGGLGPTSDDFTRDVVTEWAGLPLAWHEASWQHVNDRLRSRGYTVKDIQRQQCYFPEGSEVLINSQGTANAFTLMAHGKKLFILPGPPREIEAVWQDSIQQWLLANTRDLDPVVTRSWDTMGVGESDIAVIVEDVLKNVAVEKGYRVHLPYVECKMTFAKSQENEMRPYVEAVTEALRFCLISRDGEDVSEILVHQLQSFPEVAFEDAVSGSYLATRLLPSLRPVMSEKSWRFSSSVQEGSSGVVLRLLPIDEHSARVEVLKGSQSRWSIVTAPYKTMNMRERRLQFFAEMALVTWSQLLR